MVKYGVDLGGDSTKVCNCTTQVQYPSVVSDRQDSVMNTPRKGIVFDEPAIYVGDVALHYGAVPVHQRDDTWIHSDEFLHLFIAGLSEGTAETTDAVCVVGLPLSLYKAGKDVVIKRFQTTHRFQRAGREEQLIDVTQVIPMPQGIGAGYREIFDAMGNVRNQSLLDGTFGVIDIGSKNINLAWIDQGQDVGHKTKALETGCWKIVAQLTELLQEKLDRKLTPYQVRAVMQDRAIQHQGKRVDCAKDVTAAIQKVAPEMLSDVKSLWTDWQALDVIFICGGGAFIIGKSLMEFFKTARIVDDPILANAQGFARYAQFITQEG